MTIIVCAIKAVITVDPSCAEVINIIRVYIAFGTGRTIFDHAVGFVVCARTEKISNFKTQLFWYWCAQTQQVDNLIHFVVAVPSTVLLSAD